MAGETTSAVLSGFVLGGLAFQHLNTDSDAVRVLAGRSAGRVLETDGAAPGAGSFSVSPSSSATAPPRRPLHAALHGVQQLLHPPSLPPSGCRGVRASGCRALWDGASGFGLPRWQIKRKGLG